MTRRIRTPYGGGLSLACVTALTLACAPQRDDSVTARDDRETNRPEGDRTGAVGTVGEAARDAFESRGDVREFVREAAMGGNAEVELGKLAAERAASAGVKQFGERMVQDHTKASQELKQAVSGHDVQAPTGMDEQHQDLRNRLQRASGAEFDRQYMDAMVEGHEKMRGLLQRRANDADRRDRTATTTAPAAGAGRGGDDELEAAVNRWATATVPTVEQHLQQAREIQQRLTSNRQTSR
jgi:predicted outer membrane protein